jgi:hypothetical protein
MLRPYAVPLAFLVLAGCQDRQPSGRVPLAPTAPDHQMSAEQRPGRSDFDFGAVRDWAAKTPEEKRRIRQEQAEAHARAGTTVRGPVAVAVVPDDLPEGELAIAIRDPTAEVARLVVLSEKALHGDALYVGAATLEIDEKDIPDAGGRRVLHVWADGRIRSESDGSVRWIDPAMLPQGAKSPLSGFLERGAGSVTPIHLPGIGRGRLLQF